MQSGSQDRNRTHQAVNWWHRKHCKSAIFSVHSRAESSGRVSLKHGCIEGIAKKGMFDHACTEIAVAFPKN